MIEITQLVFDTDLFGNACSSTKSERPIFNHPDSLFFILFSGV